MCEDLASFELNVWINITEKLTLHLEIKMSLVNGYRVKCSSYKNLEKRDKSIKQREENLGK